MPRATMLVKSEVLAWARESIGFSIEEAADALGIDSDTLRTWENEDHSFGITQVRQFAAKYKRPVVAILRTTTPPLPEVPQDYRTINGLAPRLSPTTLLAIRDAQRIQGIATELMGQDEEFLYAEASMTPPEVPTADIEASDPEQMANFVRDRLGVSLDSQLRWANANLAYNSWRTRIQKQGIIVLAKSMPRGDCRGFSLPEMSPVPVIVVNQSEVDRAKNFTLFHEYGHLMLGLGGICQEREEVDSRRVEHWCNAFAAAVLVPRADLASIASTQVTLSEVERLASRFKVGRPVIAISLMELGRVSQNIVDALFDQDEETAWNPGFPTEEEFPGRPAEEIRLTELGVGYPSLVLAAWRRGLIDTPEVCEFLSIRANKLDVLNEKVHGRLIRHGQ